MPAKTRRRPPRAEVGYGHFLANERVTVERLIEGWSEQARPAVAGRHVLAIQDTSEIHFSTRPKHRRGLGEVGKGNAPALSPTSWRQSTPTTAVAWAW